MVWIRELLGQARRRSCVTHLTVFVYEKNRDFPLNLRLTTNAHVTKSNQALRSQPQVLPLCLLCGPAGLQLNWDGAKYISSLFVFLILPTSFSVESVPIPCCWSDWVGCRMRAWLVVIHSILRLLWLISPAWLKQDGVPLIWQNE